MTDIASTLGASGIRPRTYVASGGLASLRYLVEAQASLLGTPLSVSNDQEASARGAAFLAGICQGAWTFQDLDRCVPSVSPVVPLRDPDLARRYREWRDLHRQLARDGA
jgi:glycerol kinase